MTEDEAKGKIICWRTIGTGQPIGHCFGSGCTAWRWGEPYQIDLIGKAYSVDARLDFPTKVVTTGYCGLVGKP